VSVSNVWKEKTEPLTWRHFVMAIVWVICLIPMLLFIVGAVLADVADRKMGALRVWANPESYTRRPGER
jgi:uncharacterized membrane protein YoaK (UPF0700 family)